MVGMRIGSEWTSLNHFKYAWNCENCGQKYQIKRLLVIHKLLHGQITSQADGSKRLMEWADKYEKTNQFDVMNGKQKVSDDELKIGSSFILYSDQIVTLSSFVQLAIASVFFLLFSFSAPLSLFPFPSLLLPFSLRCEGKKTKSI